MSKVKIQGNASGTGVLTVTAPNTSTDRTITLPDATGTLLNSDGSGANLTGLPNGSQLDHSGSKKIEATATGITVTDDIKVGTTDNGKITSTFALTLDPPTGEPILFRSAGTDIARFRPGGGLCFGTDTASANALDDYEEGTWQPSYTTSSGSITAHPTYSLCRYTKIGRVVQIQGLVSTSAVSSPSGSVKMYGLPFTVDNNTSGEDSGAAAIAVANIVDFASSLHMLTINPQTGGTYLNFTEFNGTSTNSNIANRWQVDTYFRFSGTYTTN